MENFYNKYNEDMMMDRPSSNFELSSSQNGVK